MGSMMNRALSVLGRLTSIDTYRFNAKTIVDVYTWYWRRRMGLTVHYSDWEGYRFCYISRGTPGGPTPSMLLLHGFSGSKDLWLPVVEHLPRNQHVVCVDMPGHAGTSRTGPEDYSIQGQAIRIHQFVKSIGLDERPFHLVGTSMGGGVAGVYAASYPAHLSSITMICPAGIDYPNDTEFMGNMKEMYKTQQLDKFPLIPTNLQEVEETFKLCCCTPIESRLVLNGILDNMKLNRHVYEEVVRTLILKSLYSLQDVLHLITTPVQVIWGKGDMMLDVSGAAALQAALPNCQVTVLDNCGHAVPLDQPEKNAKLLMDFLSAQEVSGENNKNLS